MGEKELKELQRQTRILAEQRGDKGYGAGFMLGLILEGLLIYFWPEVSLPTWVWLTFPVAMAFFGYWVYYRAALLDRD